MNDTQYKEKTGSKTLPPLSRKTVDLVASGYEWECPCGTLNQEIEIPELDKNFDNGAVICSKCGKRYRTETAEHAHG